MTPPPDSAVLAELPLRTEPAGLRPDPTSRKPLPPDRSAAARPRSAAVRWTLHLTRRAHLYAGLLLVPWVFLYGVTGFLFNHPNLWPDRGVLSLGAGTIQGTALGKLPTATEQAADLLATLRTTGHPELQFVDTPAPRFGRTAYTATVRDAAGTTYNVLLQPNGTGTVRPGPPAPAAGPNPGGGRGAGGPPSSGERRGNRPPREPRTEESAPGQPTGATGTNGSNGAGEGRRPRAAADAAPASPIDVPRGLALTVSPIPLIEKDLGQVLTRAGLREPVVTSVRMSPLSFSVADSETTWRAEFNAETGGLTGRPAEAPAAGQDMSFKRFLLRLHTMHHYPDEMDMRWVWAVLVDATSLVMVFWGISGIVMWWQIKRTRLLGGLCLFVSTCAAAWIGIGMHELLAAAPVR